MPQQKIALSGERTGIIRENRDADVAITPGELLDIAANDNLEPHGTAAINAAAIVALEPIGVEAASGVNIIDTDYAIGDTVRAWYPQKGAEGLMFLDSTSANAAAGDFLESSGNGNLRVLVTDTATDDTQRESVVAIANEDVTSPGSGRSRIRVIYV